MTYYPDGHQRYRIVTDDDEVLDSYDFLFHAEQALCRALNEDCDVYLQDAEESS